MSQQYPLETTSGPPQLVDYRESAEWARPPPQPYLADWAQPQPQVDPVLPISDAEAIREAHRLQSEALAQLAQMKPRLGIAIEDLPNQAGVSVVAVKSDSSGSMAGVVHGDHIKAFDGEPVRNSDDFQNHLAQCEVGDKIVLDIERGGILKQFSLRVGAKDQTMAEVLSVWQAAHSVLEPELVAAIDNKTQTAPKSRAASAKSRSKFTVTVDDDESEEDSSSGEESSSEESSSSSQVVAAPKLPISLSPEVAQDPAASQDLLKRLVTLTGILLNLTLTNHPFKTFA